VHTESKGKKIQSYIKERSPCSIRGNSRQNIRMVRAGRIEDRGCGKGDPSFFLKEAKKKAKGPQKGSGDLLKKRNPEKRMVVGIIGYRPSQPQQKNVVWVFFRVLR